MKKSKNRPKSVLGTQGIDLLRNVQIILDGSGFSYIMIH